MKISPSVSDTINEDMTSGIYDNFPKLKDRLIHISHKVTKMKYVVNCDGLTTGELLTLLRNEYISQADFNELSGYEK